MEEYARPRSCEAEGKCRVCDGAVRVGGCGGGAVLRGYRRVVQRRRLVRHAPEESLEGIPGCDGGELPGGDRRGQAAADEVHDRDDAVELAGRAGRIYRLDPGS